MTPRRLVEPPQCIVVGVLPAGQPQAVYLVSTGRRQLAGRAYSSHESVEPHAHNATGMVGRSSQRISVQIDSHFGPLDPIEPIYELSHKAGGVVIREQLV